MVLNWIGGGKVDHPMADARQARQIVDELPASDPLKALEEITEWLESLNRTEGFKLDRRFENVDLLDAAARNHQRKLSQDYLVMPRQLKFQENKLWNGVSGFWRELGDAYVLCVKGHESGFSGASAIRKSLPVIVARALRALTLRLKWSLLRYGPVDPRIWSGLAGLYQLAEHKGVTDGVIAVYPGAHGESTVKREFLKAMMLSASSTDGLPPLRQEIAGRAASQFADAFLCSNRPEGCTHCFDLAAPKAPVRLFKGTEPAATVRFFGAGDGLARLNQLMSRIRETGGIPSGVNLGGNYDKEVVLGVLKHLEQYWSDKLPPRGSERRATAGRIAVVPGMDGILGTLDPSAGNELDFSRNQTAESWIVENVSDGGYGAIIPARKSDWMRVGTLIGVKSEMQSHWGIGLIRRIASDEFQQRRVGIQLLSGTAIPVQVSKANTMSSLNFNLDAVPAVLLSTVPDRQGEIGVVMRGGCFNARDSLEMTVRDRSYLLMPARMVEGGEDFDWAKFKIMQKSA